MADFFELFKMLQTAGSYGFKTLVDTCDIVYRILSTLQNQQHIMYSPLTIANSQAAAFLTMRAPVSLDIRYFGYRASFVLLFMPNFIACYPHGYIWVTISNRQIGGLARHTNTNE